MAQGIVRCVLLRIIRIIKEMCINLVAKNTNTEYDDNG
jgi:hypothetical protein